MHTPCICLLGATLRVWACAKVSTLALSGAFSHHVSGREAKFCLPGAIKIPALLLMLSELNITEGEEYVSLLKKKQVNSWKKAVK